MITDEQLRVALHEQFLKDQGDTQRVYGVIRDVAQLGPDEAIINGVQRVREDRDRLREIVRAFGKAGMLACGKCGLIMKRLPSPDFDHIKAMRCSDCGEPIEY